MKLSEMISKQLILQFRGENKENLLRTVCDKAMEQGIYSDPDNLYKAIMYRESLMSTGIGLHVAVPHARMDDISEPFVAVAVDYEGVRDYESMDSLPINLVFMIIAGKGTHREYLRMLSGIVAMVKSGELVKALLNTETTDEIYEIMRETNV